MDVMTARSASPDEPGDVADVSARTAAGSPPERGVSGLDRHGGRADEFVQRAVAAQQKVARAEAALSALFAEAHAWAREVAAALPHASSRTADLEVRDLAAQLGAALRVSDRTVQSQLHDATTLATLFPTTAAAWSNGTIDRRRVTVIMEAGEPITDAAGRAWFERRAVDLARELSAAELRPAARRLAEHAQHDPLAVRHERARRRRRVVVTDLDDGMARLIADLPAVLAYGIHDRLTSMAGEVRAAGPRSPEDGDGDGHTGAGVTTGAEATTGSDAAGAGDDAGDGRCTDELRADILADLLLAGAPHAHGDGLDRIGAIVQVTVPVLTVVGASTEPCVLAGYGPIPLDHALRLAGAASGWDRVMTSPVDGSVLSADRYRPSEQLRRLLRARDEHCRFVGCRQPAWRCDVDHTVDHARGGSTDTDNLAHLCRRHHVLKHRSAWSVEQLGRGRLRWRSPAGRAYTDRPAPTVRFVGDADPPPF
jgi:hypothetical protein